MTKNVFNYSTIKYFIVIIVNEIFNRFFRSFVYTTTTNAVICIQ